MKIYRVGGSARDELLGLPIKDKDYVVIGSSNEEMVANGFVCVGNDFPVFLHPITKEEYALARTEQKTELGYKGFLFNTHNVTLEEDLTRRDITINSIAIDIDGKYIDPCNGIYDLTHKIIRHNTNSFSEDPLRLLRVCRFLAKFHHLGFIVHEDTKKAIMSITKEEIDTISPERIWLETKKALTTTTPYMFFKLLEETGKLINFFPELYNLIGKTHNTKYHGEGDAWEHSLKVLTCASKLSNNPEIRLAALLHDIGKSVSPIDKLPKHHGHEKAGYEIAEKLCKRLTIPNRYKKLVLISVKYHLKHHKVFDMTPKKILKLLMDLDAFRNPDRFEDFLIVCFSDQKGRIVDGVDLENINNYPQMDYLKACKSSILEIDNKSIFQKYAFNRAMEELHKERLNRIKNIKYNFKLLEDTY